MNNLNKNQRIATLENQVKELQRILGVNYKPLPVLKQLDQSVFNGLDKQWQWAAVDEDNECFLYIDKPVINASISFFISQDDELKVGVDYDSTNWENSLIKREAEAELTGSDLCRAMLARGDKYVMCSVSDDDQEDTMLDGMESVINSYSDEGGFYGYDYFWGYVTPINNQGEPLTAKDVGL